MRTGFGLRCTVSVARYDASTHFERIKRRHKLRVFMYTNAGRSRLAIHLTFSKREVPVGQRRCIAHAYAHTSTCRASSTASKCTDKRTVVAGEDVIGTSTDARSALHPALIPGLAGALPDGSLPVQLHSAHVPRRVVLAVAAGRTPVHDCVQRVPVDAHTVEREHDAEFPVGD